MYVNPFWLGFLVGIVFTIGLAILLAEFPSGRKK